ncbi:MAG: SPOR domain-containing protein, partial [Alphaproteobacteria bacterium]|nr:SPOR domain-containing protein [Alphaproteobacteria bacterium]
TIVVAQELSKRATPQALTTQPKRASAAPTPLVREPKLTSVPGRVVQGRFYPAPQVKQMKVSGKQRIYIQAGAFAQKENATRLKQTLSKVATATVSPINIKGKKLFRVRLGPLKDVKEADRVLAKVLPQSDKARITVE